MDRNSLTELKAIDYSSTEKFALVNVNEISLDTKADIQTRIQKFISEVKNPYILKCGKTVVEVEFLDVEKSLDFQIKNYLKSLKTEWFIMRNMVKYTCGYRGLGNSKWQE